MPLKQRTTPPPSILTGQGHFCCEPRRRCGLLHVEGHRPDGPQIVRVFVSCRTDTTLEQSGRSGGLGNFKTVTGVAFHSLFCDSDVFVRKRLCDSLCSFLLHVTVCEVK